MEFLQPSGTCHLLQAAAYLFSSRLGLYLSGPSTGGCCLSLFLCTDPVLERTLHWRLLFISFPLYWSSTWADPLLEAAVISFPLYWASTGADPLLKTAAYLFSFILSFYLSGLYWRLLLTCFLLSWASTWADHLLKAAAYLFSSLLSFYLSGHSTGGCCLPVFLCTEPLLEQTLYWRLLLTCFPLYWPSSWAVSILEAAAYTCFPLYWASTWAYPLLEAAAYLFSSVLSLYLSVSSTRGCFLPLSPTILIIYWRLVVCISSLMLIFSYRAGGLSLLFCINPPLET